jgi:ParB family transcriptional regulator, chromosome partitioning protein
MSKAKNSATQERLAREQAERDAKMAKQKADRLAAEAKSQPDQQFGDLIEIKRIEIAPDRLRALNPDKVAEIADSMSRQGQLHPIVTRVAVNRDRYVLVVGRHRLEAAKQLGWKKIRATSYGEMTDDAALLAEVDENLCRSELSSAERAAHIAMRKEIYERLHPETKHGAAPGKAGGGKEAKDAKLAPFAEATAKATGQSARKVQRDAHRAEVLGAELIAKIKGTCLDKGVELDALCDWLFSKDERYALIDRAANGEKVSAKKELAKKEDERFKAMNAAPPEVEKPVAPVTTGSIERPIEQVRDEFAALAGETPAEPPADDPPIGEAQQPAEAPSTNGHTKPDDDRPLAEKLHFHLNDVWSSCQDQNNWPHLSGDPKVELRGAMTKFGYLRDLLPQLATLKQAVH